MYGKPDSTVYHPTYYLDVSVSRTATPTCLFATFFSSFLSVLMVVQCRHTCAYYANKMSYEKGEGREGESALHNAGGTSVSPMKHHLSKTMCAWGHKLGAISDGGEINQN